MNILDDEKTVVVKNIVTICKKKGIKYSYIANEIGISRQLFNRIINGSRHISKEEFKEIAKTLKVTQKSLLEEK